MSFKIIQTGLLTSVQDFGRFHYAAYGCPVSGAMDNYSAKFANLLLNNQIDDAVLEATLQGPTIKFEQNTRVAVAGLGAKILLNKKAKTINTAFSVSKGDTLSVPQVTEGNRVYISFAGGIQTNEVLGSRSFYASINPADKIKKGAKFKITSKKLQQKELNANLSFDASLYSTQQVEVYPGPEFSLLPESIQQQITESSFSISKENNRMAIQLNELIDNEMKPILTGPVLPGSVQLTPSGKLIVLMKDAQTTGGYPRVLQLSQSGINQISQKRVGAEFKFIVRDF
ncbi:MAG: biotin-dependent carboxyltransferase family protein [Bacteroidota bacterium]